MIARNCTQNDLEQALQLVNEHYASNLRFRSLEPLGRGFRFTLTVNATSIGKGKDRKTAPGVRHRYYSNKSGAPRRIATACWHAHGHFFECLFMVCPLVRLYSSSRFMHDLDGWITRDGGNWRDSNIGSMMYPLRMSEACACDPYEADLLTLAIRGEAVPV